MKVQASRLLTEIRCWTELLEWWSHLKGGEPARHRLLQQHGKMVVGTHQLMDDDTTFSRRSYIGTGRRSEANSARTCGKSDGDGGGGDDDDGDDDDDDDDFVRQDEWVIVKILDFQAVTRQHKSDPLCAKDSAKMIEYLCELRLRAKGSGTFSKSNDGSHVRWVEFAPLRKQQLCSDNEQLIGGKRTASSSLPALPWRRGGMAPRVLLADWVSRNAKKLPLQGRVNVLCGGPPCQGCSGHNLFRCHNPMDDDKNKQQDIMMDFLELLKPRFFCLENVLGLLQFKHGWLCRRIVKRCVHLRYSVSLQMLFAGSFGIATTRPRAIILAAAADERLPDPPRPSHHIPRTNGRYDVPLNRQLQKLVLHPAARVASAARPYNDGKMPLLRPAVTLGSAIGRLPEFNQQMSSADTPYEETSEKKNSSNNPNNTWADRWLPLSHREMRRRASCGHGGVLNHFSYTLNFEDAVRVSLIPPGGNWRDVAKFSNQNQCLAPVALVKQLGLRYSESQGEMVFRSSGKPLVLPYMKKNNKGSVVSNNPI